MGRNGSGKSSLLWALQGTGRAAADASTSAARDPAGSTGAGPARSSGWCRRHPSDLLYLDTVGEELAQADAEAARRGRRDARSRSTASRPASPTTRTRATSPRASGSRSCSRSSSRRRRSSLLLDEPTRGLDYRAKHDLGAHPRATSPPRATRSSSSTHDVEFVAATAHRVIVMAEGEIVADGPTADVIVASPAFAPQVAKILAPLPWLTVEQLERAGVFDRLEVARSSSMRTPGRGAHRPAHRGRARDRVGVRRRRVPLAVLRQPGSTLGASDVAPLIFGGLLLLVLAVVLAQISEGGLDAKALALLGVLSALGAALRPLGAGTAGVEPIFFLLVLGGRALGPGFGFSLGCTTLFASALITAGVGPWMPYQMFACAWIGLGAGLLPRATGRREIWMLAAYGALSAFVYGFLLNLSFWPFTLGADTQLSFVPGASLVENLHRYLVFDVTTSLGWDTGRAVTNALLILLAGRPVLDALRRASRRAAFDAPVAFEPA